MSRAIDTKITVVSIDDHALVRQGIYHILSQSTDIELVAEGWTGEHVFHLLALHLPNVLLLDVGLPATEESLAGDLPSRFAIIPALHRLARQFPDTRTIIVSQYDTDSLIRAAVDAGVRGYLVKDDVLTTELCDAVRVVHRGGIYFSKGVEERALTLTERQEPFLTARHLEILSALAAQPDMPRAQIAQQLYISEYTLNRYLNKIYEELDVSNLAAALIRAFQLNLLPSPQMGYEILPMRKRPRQS
jgi:DNA-binding NarL/FixJ family response regulator